MRSIPLSKITSNKVCTDDLYIDPYNIFKKSMDPITDQDVVYLKQWNIHFLFTKGLLKSQIELQSSSTQESRETIKGIKKDKSIPQDADVVEVPKDINLSSFKNVIEETSGPTDDYDLESTQHIGGFGEIDPNNIELHRRTKEIVADIFSKARNNEKIYPGLAERIIAALIDPIQKHRRQWILLASYTSKGDFLVNHSVNSTILAIILGQALGYKRSQLMELGMASLLHDIGMAAIPYYILEKEAPLTEDEHNRIKAHPAVAYKILNTGSAQSQRIADIILQHHEQYNGKGYPRGLTQDHINQSAMIINITSVYEAMIKARSYRKNRGQFEAMKIILSQASNSFDPKLVKVFLSIMSLYPVGSYVQLSDNSIATVENSDLSSPIKPIVRRIYDSQLKPIQDKDIIYLTSRDDLKISRPLSVKEVEAKVKK